ncbi:hypothetical protein ALO68_200005 [Pseudomonas syringae pv. helianthi]|uniref:DNA mismatch repair protein MutL n=1 Tax=Pseudomonas syringae pv. helianthi TaxID=251654 RepID=A0A0P9W6S9_9PSED|nr:hypothetical protein [Pseudomonas syringae group genomosp. 7]KPX46936.1 hypothetical protein ALO68_200005 [Pseudomonas syringae pv. helianthi]RMV44578.1 hypothetical protein ALP10_00432 [Pseudomonas syringae pv. helianthi]UNB66012.1 hypothetical protein MME54_27820 [Pseudomonas syringae pv. helianthi]
MLTLLAQLMLFITAVMAGRVCAANGYRNAGIAAFLLLELGYLSMWFGSWWVAGALLIMGTGIVLKCQRQGADMVVDDNAPKV